MLLACAVKPVVERRIAGPRVARADVIRYLILYRLEAKRVRTLDQFAQRLKRTEAIFDAVIINRVIAVIIGARTPGLVARRHADPVVIPRRQPQRRHAELFWTWQG